jgi:3-deoxy-manno-octulosonate cytidylyltransferase (CMP-KDO synthetase)
MAKKIQVLGIIPARLASTRLPNKMLLPIDGKPLFYHTWVQAKKAKMLDALILATDSPEIQKVAENLGIPVMMTSTAIQSGSDRVAAAAKKFKQFTPDIVVNIQGDEPLMPPQAIDNAVKALIKDKTAVVSTPATKFKKEKDVESPNFVKVVIDKNSNALYFSRSVLPYPRDIYSNYYKHLGLYVFRFSFLKQYVKLKQTPLEKAEKLEQLRILEHGYKIKVVPGDFPTLEVNTQEEYEQVKKIMEGRA